MANTEACIAKTYARSSYPEDALPHARPHGVLGAAARRQHLPKGVRAQLLCDRALAVRQSVRVHTYVCGHEACVWRQSVYTPSGCRTPRAPRARCPVVVVPRRTDVYQRRQVPPNPLPASANAPAGCRARTPSGPAGGAPAPPSSGGRTLGSARRCCLR